MKSRLVFKGYTKRAKRILYPTVVLATLNFLSFALMSLYIGGDALNGYVNAGKYFVCSHGSCTQVSPEMWRYSYWHATTAWLGIFLVFSEVALFVNTGDIMIDWDATRRL